MPMSWATNPKNLPNIRELKGKVFEGKVPKIDSAAENSNFFENHEKQRGERNLTCEHAKSA